jgi:putative PEP-CTERM system TPR-repeat lipoprotein
VVRGKGFELLDDLGQATVAYERAIQLEPRNAEAYLGQARVAFAVDDPARALAAIDKALEVQPASAAAWEMLGEMRYRAEDRHGAETAFARVLDLNPGSWTACCKRAVVRLDLGDVAGAEEDLRCMDRLNRDFAGGKLVRGRLALAAGALEEAALHFDLYVNQAPGDPQGHFLAASVLTALGRNEAARATLERYFAVAPKRVDAILPAARLLLRTGDADGAEALLKGLGSTPEERAAVDAVMVDVLAQQGRYDEAASLVRAMPADGADETQRQRALARLAARRGDWAETAALAAALAESDAASVDDRLLLVTALVRLGRNDDALAAAEALAQRAGDNPSAQYALGVARLAADGAQPARQAWQEALRIDPSFERAAVALARLDTATGDADAARRILEDLGAAGGDGTRAALELADVDLRQGEPQQAVARLRGAVEADPEALAPRLRLARALAASGDIRAALDALPPAADGEPQPALLRLRGLLELQTGQVEDAVATLERLLSVVPEDGAARYRLAQGYARLGRFDLLTQTLARALEEAPDSPLVQPTLDVAMQAMPNAEVRDRLLAALHRAAPAQPALQYLAAVIAHRGGDPAVALKHMRAARDGAPDSPAVTAGLLSLLLEQGAAHEARRLAEQWFSTHPDDVRTRLIYATGLLRSGHRERAVDQYQAVLSVAADTPEALNNLAALTSEDAPREALGMARRAVELAPDEPAYADTLGEILLRLGRTDEARAVLADAYERFPGNATIVYRYAVALSETGALQQARLLLLEVVGRVFPEQADAKSLLEKLGG